MKKTLILMILISVSIAGLAENENKHYKQKALPPGLQKKYERTGELPPGWQKKLVKGEVLDPGLYAIARRYPVNPADYHLEYVRGTELFRLEDRIIRIVNDTSVVLDIFGINTN